MSAARPAGQLKAVLDTNVYFSAFSSTRGVPFELWQRAVTGDYSLLVSPAILRELADVLRTDLERAEPEIIAQLKRDTGGKDRQSQANLNGREGRSRRRPDFGMRGGGKRRCGCLRRSPFNSSQILPGNRHHTAS